MKHHVVLNFDSVIWVETLYITLNSWGTLGYHRTTYDIFISR